MIDKIKVVKISNNAIKLIAYIDNFECCTKEVVLEEMLYIFNYPNDGDYNLRFKDKLLKKGVFECIIKL